MRTLRTALAIALGFSLIVPMSAPAVSVAGLRASQSLAPREASTGQLPKAKSNPIPQSFSAGSCAPVDGLWVVRTEPIARDRVRQRLGTLGCTVRRTGYSGSLLVSVPKERQDFVAATIRRTAGVLSFEKAVGMRATGAATLTPDDPRFADQWGLDRIGAPYAWPISQGEGVTIAVVDTGVDYKHADLASRIETDIAYDFVGNRSGAQDDNGHGTHVSGIAAGSINSTCGVGVAPLAKILPVKVLDSEGWGTDFQVAQGIMYAADKGADVINVSLGGWYASEELVAAVEYAQAKGSLIVAATGNEGDRVSYPAAMEGVLAVGATTVYDRIAGFSCTGPEVDVVAPGVDILSAKRRGGMTIGTGTSMAAPFVAGTAALIKANEPALSAAEISARITSTAEDRGRTGKDIQYGYGRLNTAKAVGAASGGADIGPAVPSDNDIPGVALRASSSPTTQTTTGSLDIDEDFADVYRVDLAAGDRLDLSLSAPANAEFGLVLFSPDSDSIYAPSWPLGMGERDEDSRQPYPLTLSYAAPKAGEFYALVYNNSGKGEYQLTSAITTPVPNDDALPGLEPTPGTVRGTLDDMRDVLDVYRVHLEKGQRLAAHLDYPSMLSYEEMMAIYDMYGDEDVDLPMQEFYIGTCDNSYWSTEQAVYSGIGDYSPGVAITADEDGDFFFFAYAASGSGAYQVTWEVLDPAVDDEVPGIVLSESSGIVTGTVDAPFDFDDIYAIDVPEGKRVNVSVESSPSPKGVPYIDADVGLIDQNSTSLQDAGYSAASALDGPDALTYTTRQDGRYKIHVRAWGDGMTDYTMRWSILDEGTPEITSSASALKPAYGVPATLTAEVTSGGSPMVDQCVRLQKLAEGEWMTTATGLTDAQGRIDFTCQQSRSEEYRVVARDGYDSVALAEPIEIKPGVRLNRPKTRTKYTVRGRVYTWTGRVWPSHQPETKAVWLRVQRLEGGVWVTKKRVLTEQTRYTAYAARIRIDTRGTYRICAYHREDADNSASMGGSTYFTVK